MGSTFCTRVSLARVTVTGVSSSSKLQRSSFGPLISRRQRRCQSRPSASLQPPGVTGAPRSGTEPLPRGASAFLFASVLPSCPRRLCFVVFAPGTRVPHQSSQVKRFHFSLWPLIRFAEIMLARDHAVVLNKLWPAAGLVPVAVLGTGWECWRGVHTPGGCAVYGSSVIYGLQSSAW